MNTEITDCKPPPTCRVRDDKSPGRSTPAIIAGPCARRRLAVLIARQGTEGPRPVQWPSWASAVPEAIEKYGSARGASYPVSGVSGAARCPSLGPTFDRPALSVCPRRSRHSQGMCRYTYPNTPIENDTPEQVVLGNYEQWQCKRPCESPS